MQMSKDIHIKDYISILRRRKWIVISFFLISVTTITIASFMQRPVYRATSTVIIDAESPNVLSLKDVVKLGESNYFAYRDYIDTQKEIIRSRRTTHHVIKNLHLLRRKEFRKMKDPITTLLKRLHVELVRDTRILVIQVDDQDPRWAARIANEFAKVYADSNLALKMKLSRQAEDWLKGEVDTQKKKVNKSELALQTYKEKSGIISLENQKKMVSDALLKLNTNYLDAQKRRIRAEDIYKSVIDAKGNLNLENMPALLTDNKTLQQMKAEYLKEKAILVEYKKVYRSKHPKMIRLLESINYLESRMKGEIVTEYKSSLEGEKKFKDAMEKEKKEALELERKVINYNVLKRELETNERILQIVLNRLKETSISSQVQTNNVRVQDLAEVPRRPIRPRKRLNIALSIIVGLVGGMGLGFLREYMDTTIRDPKEIEGLLQLPILGSIPRIRPDGKNITKKDIDRVVEKDLHSLAAEAYRTLRTNLFFSLDDSSAAKTITITSSIPREGKTLTAVNLAIMIANSGERVLLVDADMRKPRIHSIFKESNKSGLLQFLSGEKDFEGILKHPDKIDNLSFVVSGGLANKPAELLSSGNMKIFLENAMARFSKVIFDTPPVGLVTDPAVLSSMCTGTLLVTEGGRTTKALLIRSKELLEKVNAKILGVVVNNISLTNDTYSYPQYYYGKYYKPV